MRLSDLIKELSKLKEKHGDIEVLTQTLSHRWPPDLAVRKERGSDVEYVLLNS